jgi:serine O-acetyltransferase
VSTDADWRADLRRYPPRPWLREQSIWAIALYRFGRRNDARPRGLVRWIFDRFYWAAFRVIETLSGISMPKGARIGPGLRIYHFGNVFVHNDAVIGANCTLRQGVTIGNRHNDGAVPVLEDDVELGAYAQVLGGVRIGRGARIGAMSVVLRDVPPGATAVGVPARIIVGDASDAADDAMPPPPPEVPAYASAAHERGN